MWNASLSHCHWWIGGRTQLQPSAHNNAILGIRGGRSWWSRQSKAHAVNWPTCIKCIKLARDCALVKWFIAPGVHSSINYWASKLTWKGWHLELCLEFSINFWLMSEALSALHFSIPSLYHSCSLIKARNTHAAGGKSLIKITPSDLYVGRGSNLRFQFKLFNIWDENCWSYYLR